MATDSTIALYQIPSRVRRSVFNDGESATWTHNGVRYKATPNGTVHPTITAVLRWTESDDGIMLGSIGAGSHYIAVAMVTAGRVIIFRNDAVVESMDGGKQEAEEAVARAFLR